MSASREEVDTSPGKGSGRLGVVLRAVLAVVLLAAVAWVPLVGRVLIAGLSVPYLWLGFRRAVAWQAPEMERGRGARLLNLLATACTGAAVLLDVIASRHPVFVVVVSVTGLLAHASAHSARVRAGLPSSVDPTEQKVLADSGPIGRFISDVDRNCESRLLLVGALLLTVACLSSGASAVVAERPTEPPRAGDPNVIGSPQQLPNLPSIAAASLPNASVSDEASKPACPSDWHEQLTKSSPSIPAHLVPILETRYSAGGGERVLGCLTGEQTPHGEMNVLELAPSMRATTSGLLVITPTGEAFAVQAAFREPMLAQFDEAVATGNSILTIGYVDDGVGEQWFLFNRNGSCSVLRRSQYADAVVSIDAPSWMAIARLLLSGTEVPMVWPTAYGYEATVRPAVGGPAAGRVLQVLRQPDGAALADGYGFDGSVCRTQALTDASAESLSHHPKKAP
jgi:hypothetical protein